LLAAGLLLGGVPAVAADASPQAASAPAAKPATARQKSFASPEAAAEALLAAMKSGNPGEGIAVLGPGSDRVIYSGDRVADAKVRNDVAAAMTKSTRVEVAGPGKAMLILGANDYPFPFPLVKGALGWRFDAKAGAEEVVNRRIGENEIGAMRTCLAFADAQREYAERDRDGDGLREYARKFVSEEGSRDGLWWDAPPGDPSAPLGGFVAAAVGEGYGGPGTRTERQPYHGYYFRILTAQGGNAKGGAYDYVVKGNMIGGFAFVAWPARWGVSGVMTFVCSHEGVVYQRNLGPATARIAGAMAVYDPGPGWGRVENWGR
jgi:hypothetical protein